MNEFKISDQIPEIYYKCQEKYGVNWSKGVVITYGDTVYCKFTLSPDLLVHEGIHVKQQAKIGKDVWWEQYFNNDSFRLSQEKEAYIAQSKWLKRHIKDRNKRFVYLNKIATDFSSSMYGNIITKEEANKLLL